MDFSEVEKMIKEYYCKEYYEENPSQNEEVDVLIEKAISIYYKQYNNIISRKKPLKI